MASLLSSSTTLATLSPSVKATGTGSKYSNFTITRVPMVDGLRILHKTQPIKATKRSSRVRFNTRISCLMAQPETLQTVQITIAKQLSIDESNVTPETKFADLGADSLDTVEIMMALEEKFNVSIGEGGAENIATVQDAANLIEKVKCGEE